MNFYVCFPLFLAAFVGEFLYDHCNFFSCQLSFSIAIANVSWLAVVRQVSYCNCNHYVREECIGSTYVDSHKWLMHLPETTIMGTPANLPSVGL